MWEIGTEGRQTLRRGFRRCSLSEITIYDIILIHFAALWAVGENTNVMAVGRMCRKLAQRVASAAAEKHGRDMISRRRATPDHTTVLQRARRLFWRDASEAREDSTRFSGTCPSGRRFSCEDLGALPHSLEQYTERSTKTVETALARSLPVREAIAVVLGELIEQILAEPKCGCCGAYCAPRGGSANRTARIRSGMDRAEARFREVLCCAKDRGELPARVNVIALAYFLTSGIYGLRVIGQARGDRAVLNDVAAVMLRSLTA